MNSLVSRLTDMYDAEFDIFRGGFVKTSGSIYSNRFRYKLEDDKIIYTICIPGVDKKDINLYIEDDILFAKTSETLSSISIYSIVDKDSYKAELKNGILKVEFKRLNKLKELKID